MARCHQCLLLFTTHGQTPAHTHFHSCSCWVATALNREQRSTRVSPPPEQCRNLPRPPTAKVSRSGQSAISFVPSPKVGYSHPLGWWGWGGGGVGLSVTDAAHPLAMWHEHDSPFLPASIHSRETLYIDDRQQDKLSGRPERSRSIDHLSRTAYREIPPGGWWGGGVEILDRDTSPFSRPHPINECWSKRRLSWLLLTSRRNWRVARPRRNCFRWCSPSANSDISLARTSILWSVHPGVTGHYLSCHLFG